MEQVPGLTRRHGRVTERLRQTMGAIGLALAGRAGARLAHLMGIATSRTTLLRRVMDLPDPAATRPRAVGVDDFALRRGHVYGTVVIDAETHQVLDLPPANPEPEPVWETPPEATSDQNDAEADPTGRFAERARAHHALVHDLLDQGMGIRQIARHLGWGRHTVQRYARAARWQDMVKCRKRQLPSRLDPFKPYLAQRWA